MFIVSYAYYDEHCNLAAFETKEEAQALAERLGGTKVGVAVEEIGQPTKFLYDFFWKKKGKEPRVSGIHDSSYMPEGVRSVGSFYSCRVVASSYDEAVQRAKELTDS